MGVKFTIDYVRDYINGEEGNGCKLLSAEYVDSQTPLLIQCACGKTFEKSFADFKRKKKQCSACSGKPKWDFQKVKNYIEGEEGNGCKLLSPKYKNNNTKLKIQCACGEVFEKTFRDFKSGKQRQCSNCRHKKRENQVAFNCDYCGKENSIKKSHFKGKEHHFCNKECFDRWQKINVPRGKDSSNYNPNITDEERERGRFTEGSKQWIKDVYERDNYTCQCCGDNRGGNLNAHHLNGHHWDKEHRTDVDNGVTLCEDCHKEFHKIYGYGNNTIAQFREFLFNKYTQSHDLKFLSLIETIDLTTRAF